MAFPFLNLASGLVPVVALDPGRQVQISVCEEAK
jgi:hypothetical protein